MFNAKSSTIACPECGQRNRAEARFCEACAARLGAEPLIASTRPPTRAPLPQAAAPMLHAPQAASGAARGDSRFDAPRTVHSRPMPLQEASNTGFWFKFCMAGLAVMIGFIAWSLYMLTGSKAPMQLPAAQVGVETPPVGPATPPAAASPSPAPSSPPPVNVAPSPSTAATADASPRSPAPTAPAPQAASTVPPAAPRPATEARERPAPQRQAATRERVRPPPAEVRPTDYGGWVEPSRPPAMTSAPNYQDAGPPIVPGPGPREPLPMTSPAQPAGNVATTGRQDLGPPVTVGPGPRYDYSTPNALGR